MLAMISRLLKNQEVIKATLSHQKHKLVMLTASEWDKLKKLETLLEPCRWLKIASALDPRFKDLKHLPKGEREEVWTSLEVLLQNEPSKTTSKPLEEPAKKRSLLFLTSDSESDDDVIGLNRALNRYKAEPSICMEACPLQWWSTHAGAHQELSVLACKYLASPATSVPCERLFSLAGNIVQKRRAALASENVDKLVCLSNWLREA
ncbi:hypothetical protein MHYP_G00172590 [Metynnis hypsauchen]